MTELTQDRLKELLDYNPETGLFSWRTDRNQNVKTGDIAGTLQNKGYIHIHVNSKKYVAHRLAWLYIMGEWPKDQIDHINQKRHDNRFINLRECSQSQNQGNQKIHDNSKSGYKGVTWYKKYNKWMASISRNGKRKTLGYFNCKHDAAKIYNEKAREFWGEFAYLNKVA